jgi:hypothetical protein
MATVNYSVTTSGTHFNWSGTLEVPDLNATVSSTVPTNITVSGGLSFVPQSFRYYPDLDIENNGNEYITWSTYNGSSQYPDSGYSFDVWSTSLYSAVDSGITWSTLQVSGAYPLNSNKWTLIYDYDQTYSPNLYGVGGTITFT